MHFSTQATLVASVVLLAASPVGSQTASQSASHRVYTPQEITWVAGPSSMPKGVEAALLYGDPTKEGPFSLRLRFPANYQIPPHRHPGAEILTIISGTFIYGAGEAADRSKAQPMPAGSFTVMPPNMAHFGLTDEVTVIQLNSIGPWSITYVNPADDPRRPQ